VGRKAVVWMKNQYEEALARGRAEGKLVFLNFTGYACTNCHWMKSNMFRGRKSRRLSRLHSVGVVHGWHGRRFGLEPTSAHGEVLNSGHSVLRRCGF